MRLVVSAVVAIDDPHVLNGLLVARGLLDRADVVRDGSDPGEITAIVLLDLAVESAAKATLGDKLRRGANFKETIDALNHAHQDGRHQEQLEGTKRVLDLRDLRNLAQHSGTVPSTSDVERYRVHARDFLDTVTQRFLGHPLHTISVALLITDEGVRHRLEESEAAFSSDDLATGSEQLAVAFELILRNHRARQPWRRRGSLNQYDLRRAVDALRAPKVDVGLVRKLKDLLSAIPTKRSMSSVDLDKLARLALGAGVGKTDPLLRTLQGFATELAYLSERAEAEALVRDAGDHAWFRARVGRALPVGSGAFRYLPSDPPLEADEVRRAQSFVADTALREQASRKSPAPSGSKAGLAERRLWEDLKDRIVEVAKPSGQVSTDDLAVALDNPSPDDVEPALGELVAEGRLVRIAPELYGLSGASASD